MTMPDLKTIGARLTEMDHAETQLREALLKAPDYYAADLSELVSLHTVLATEFQDICHTHGWPTIAMVGWESAHSAARLSRNCFSKPDFMRGCLPLAEQACRFGEIGGNWFTELYDALMYFENKPQVFGNIVDWNEQLQVGPWTIVEPKELEMRREAFALDALEKTQPELIKRFEEKNQRPLDYKKYRAGFLTWTEQQGWKHVRETGSGI